MQKIFVLFIMISTAFASVTHSHEAPSTPAAMEAYIEKHLLLFDVEAKYIKTYTDDQVPAFRYAIKNNGPEALTKIRLTVFYLDKEGKPFFEDDYTPVWVTDSGFNDDKPLKPNYTFRMEENRWMTEKRLGDEWGGKINIKIVYIEFVE